MMHEFETETYSKPARAGVFAGMLVGALAGAAAILLLAPQTGKVTRQQIRAKGMELRDRTSGLVEDTLAQVRSSTTKLGMAGKTDAEKMVAEQLDDASEALQAGRHAFDRP